MARADLILNLIKASRQGDEVQVRKTVEALAADERAKKHTILADRLLAQLQADNGRSGQPAPLPQSLGGRSSGSGNRSSSPPGRPDSAHRGRRDHTRAGDRTAPRRPAALVRAGATQPRTAGRAAGKRQDHARRGRWRTPCTSPLLSVRYESVIGSYLGETAQRIAQVFEHASSRHCVLFFDEFDSVGKERGDVHETGEIKRVVSSLLLRIDAVPGYVVVVTASNHPELLDRAVWRRFQIRLELPSPTQGRIEEWFKRFENRHGQPLGRSPRSLAQRLRGLSFAEVEDFGTDVLRQIALNEPGADVEAIVERRLRHWKKRFTLRQPGDSGDGA